MVITIMGIQPGWAVRTTGSGRLGRDTGLDPFFCGKIGQIAHVPLSISDNMGRSRRCAGRNFVVDAGLARLITYMPRLTT
jgi:hypothetical protein